MATQEAQRTQFLSTAPTGQESTSDTSVIRGMLCLVPQSEDARPAVNGADMQYNVRIMLLHVIQWINSDQCRVFNISKSGGYLLIRETIWQISTTIPLLFLGK